MGTIALKSLIALIPAGMVLSGSIVLTRKNKTVPFVLQVVGAACLTLVVLTHVCESLHLLSWMGWGLENSPAHYVDFVSVVVALTLFPVGYLWGNVRTARAWR